jgi:ABC-type nickel/cobalt efflux system permease component RcnA
MRAELENALGEMADAEAAFAELRGSFLEVSMMIRFIMRTRTHAHTHTHTHPDPDMHRKTFEHTHVTCTHTYTHRTCYIKK